ncbi:MAG: hypothetical protein AAGL69_12630 [Pseudomonadota bacterium]
MASLMHIREHHSLRELLEPALSMTCPHCGVYAQMTVQATPAWQWLITNRPRRIGISALCPACRRPVFLCSGPVTYADDELTIDGLWEPVVKPLPSFELDRLPAELVDPVTEALACYRDGHWQALVMLSHRITLMCADAMGSDGRMTLFNAVTEAASLAGVDDALARFCRDILFDLDSATTLPSLSPSAARVLVALLKDMLHEAFVRRDRLREAMRRVAHDARYND